MSILNILTSGDAAAPLPVRIVLSAFLIAVLLAARGTFAFLRRCGGSSCGSSCFRGGGLKENVFLVRISESWTPCARLSQSAARAVRRGRHGNNRARQTCWTSGSLSDQFEGKELQIPPAPDGSLTKIERFKVLDAQTSLITIIVGARSHRAFNSG